MGKIAGRSLFTMTGRKRVTIILGMLFGLTDRRVRVHQSLATRPDRLLLSEPRLGRRAESDHQRTDHQSRPDAVGISGLRRELQHALDGRDFYPSRRVSIYDAFGRRLRALARWPARC